MSSSTVIVGADSQIGAALARRLVDAGQTVHGTSRRAGAALQLDLGTPASFAATVALAPSDAVLCAAVPGNDAIERDPRAREINVTSTIELIRQLTAAGTHVWFLSTNMVFDGTAAAPTPHAPPSPKTTYGAWKSEVEQFILRDCSGRGSVVRLTKVLAPAWPLGRQVLEAARSHAELDAFEDWRFSPILLADVATALARLVTERPSRTPPVFHFSALDTISYADGLAHLAGLAGGGAHQIRRTSIESRRTVAWNPRHTSLACEWESAHLAWPRRTSLETLQQWYEQERHAA